MTSMFDNLQARLAGYHSPMEKAASEETMELMRQRIHVMGIQSDLSKGQIPAPRWKEGIGIGSMIGRALGKNEDENDQVRWRLLDAYQALGLPIKPQELDDLKPSELDSLWLKASPRVSAQVWQERTASVALEDVLPTDVGELFNTLTRFRNVRAWKHFLEATPQEKRAKALSGPQNFQAYPRLTEVVSQLSPDGLEAASTLLWGKAVREKWENASFSHQTVEAVDSVAGVDIHASRAASDVAKAQQKSLEEISNAALSAGKSSGRAAKL